MGILLFIHKFITTRKVKNKKITFVKNMNKDKTRNTKNDFTFHVVIFSDVIYVESVSKTP